jgi:ABC-type glycerol-3-phosphate transport system substrate-binding protein
VLDQGESELFRDGHLAFFFWGRAPTKIVRVNPALRWDIAPVPSGPGGRSTPHLSMAVGISRRTTHAALAREYLRFYVSDAGVEPAVRAGQIVPARSRQARAEAFLGEHPPASTYQFADAMDAGGVTAIAYCPGRLEAEEIVRKRFEQALSEPGVPTEEIVAALAADLRAWLTRMQAKGLL